MSQVDSQEPDVPVRDRAGRVLIVDDENGVRDLMMRLARSRRLCRDDGIERRRGARPSRSVAVGGRALRHPDAGTRRDVARRTDSAAAPRNRGHHGDRRARRRTGLRQPERRCHRLPDQALRPRSPPRSGAARTRLASGRVGRAPMAPDTRTGNRGPRGPIVQVRSSRGRHAGVPNRRPGARTRMAQAQQAAGLEIHGIPHATRVHWNLEVPALVQAAIRRREALTAADGPLVCRTGQHTGRSPNDKRTPAARTRWGSSPMRSPRVRPATPGPSSC